MNTVMSEVTEEQLVQALAQAHVDTMKARVERDQYRRVCQLWFAAFTIKEAKAKYEAWLALYGSEFKSYWTQAFDLLKDLEERREKAPEYIQAVDRPRLVSIYRVFNAIVRERERQNTQWGPEHDSHHTLQEWTSIALDELYEAIQAESPTTRLAEIIHTVTVLVAALEWFGVPKEAPCPSE